MLSKAGTVASSPAPEHYGLRTTAATRFLLFTHGAADRTAPPAGRGHCRLAGLGIDMHDVEPFGNELLPHAGLTSKWSTAWELPSKT